MVRVPLSCGGGSLDMKTCWSLTNLWRLPVIEDFFRLLSSALLYHPLLFIPSPLFPPILSSALTALSTLQQVDPLTSTLHFLRDVLAYGHSSPPSSSHLRDPSAPAAQNPPHIIAAVTSTVHAEGPQLVQRLLTGMMFSFPRDCFPDASGVLLAVVELYPQEVGTWIGRTVGMLPAGTVSQLEMERLMGGIEEYVPPSPPIWWPEKLSNPAATLDDYETASREKCDTCSKTSPTSTDGGMLRLGRDWGGWRSVVSGSVGDLRSSLHHRERERDRLHREILQWAIQRQSEAVGAHCPLRADDHQTQVKNDIVNDRMTPVHPVQLANTRYFLQPSIQPHSLEHRFVNSLQLFHLNLFTHPSALPSATYSSKTTNPHSRDQSSTQPSTSIPCNYSLSFSRNYSQTHSHHTYPHMMHCTSPTPYHATRPSSLTVPPPPFSARLTKMIRCFWISPNQPKIIQTRLTCLKNTGRLPSRNESPVAQRFFASGARDASAIPYESVPRGAWARSRFSVVAGGGYFR